jgi:hypothetical protein
MIIPYGACTVVIHGIMSDLDVVSQEHIIS